MSALSRRAAARRGLTLLELLIVVGIALAITAIAIPVLIPSQTERRMYEAGREITSMFSGARATAIETGRPVGVMLHRFPTLPQAAFTLSYAEVPPSYSGGFQHSRVHIQSVGGYGLLGQDTDTDGMINSTDDYNAAFTSDDPAEPDLSWVALARPGDVLKINHQGHLYTIMAGEPFDDLDGNGFNTGGGEPYLELNGDGSYTGPTSLADFIVDPTDDSVRYIAPGTLWVITSETAPYAPASYYQSIDADPEPEIGGFPYQIIRQPVASAGTSVELPETLVIDLTASGQEGFLFADPNGDGILTNDGATLTVLYMPGGTVGSVLWASRAIRPTTPIYLMLGRRELLPVVVGQENWRDLTNRWIGVNAASGQVTTSENFVEPAPAVPSLAGARRLAREAQSSLSRSP
jgi:type II secretory pathway pseudopilin PulG